jgi:putative ABC transport system substrate-binding protein
VTGFASFGEVLPGKRLELMRDALPRITRFAVIHSLDSVASAQELPAMRKASAALKMQLRLHEVRVEADLEGAFRAIEQERPKGLQVLPSTITYIHRKRIAEFASALRLPTFFSVASYVEAGGLMSYGVSYPDNYRRTAVYVDKILKGAKPADLPVQQPTTLELVVNLKTAKALDIAIPPSVLRRADRVIE